MFDPYQEKLVNSVIYVVLVLVLLTNFLLCFWIFLGSYDYTIENPNYKGTNSWLVTNPANFGTLEENPVKLYITSYYFIWEVMATVGYGELYSSNTEREMYFLIALEALSIGFSASVMYTVNSIFNGLDTSFSNTLR